MKKGLLFIMICLVFIETNGQDSIPVRKKVYSLNYKFEIPLTAGLYAFNYYGFVQLRQKPTLDTFQIISLDKNDIWAFDRKAVLQSASQRFQSQKISDWGMNISIFMPVLLFLDPEIRESWFDIALLYFETQAINSNLYTWAGSMPTVRKRPFVYYDEVPFDEKLETGTTDSFFSGHSSWAAGASFFMAKVLSDYHPELGAKKWLLFAAALIPPAFVGYYRYVVDNKKGTLYIRELGVDENVPVGDLAGVIKKHASGMDLTGIKTGLPHQDEVNRYLISLGAKTNRPYAWQVKILDITRFLTKLSPVLESRIEDSEFKGVSKDITLNFWKFAVSMKIEGGKIDSIEKMHGEKDRTIGLNPYAFIKLVLGYKSRLELEEMYPDFSVKGEMGGLIDVMFPKQPGFIHYCY